MRFFNGECEEDFAMIAEKDPTFKEAYDTLRRISADEEKKLQYEACQNMSKWISVYYDWI